MVQYGGIVPQGITDPAMLEHFPEDLRVQARGDHDPKRDKRLLVRFYRDEKLMGALSSKSKRFRCITTDMIAIRTDDHTEVHHEVGFRMTPDGYYTNHLGEKEPTAARAYWLGRFPEKWKFYEMKMGGKHGTPLSSYPYIEPHEIAEANQMGVYTCEGFAEVSDNLLRKFGRREGNGTWLELKSNIREFLKERGIEEALLAQKEAAERELEEYKGKLAAMEAEFQALQEKQKKESRKTAKAGGPKQRPPTDPEGVPLNQ